MDVSRPAFVGAWPYERSNMRVCAQRGDWIIGQFDGWLGRGRVQVITVSQSLLDLISFRGPNTDVTVDFNATEPSQHPSSVRFHWDHIHTHTFLQHAAMCVCVCVCVCYIYSSLESGLEWTICWGLQHTLFPCTLSVLSSRIASTHTCSPHTPSPSSYLTPIRVPQLKQKSSRRSSPLQLTGFRVIWPACCLVLQHNEQCREECHLFCP